MTRIVEKKTLYHRTSGKLALLLVWSVLVVPSSSTLWSQAVESPEADAAAAAAAAADEPVVVLNPFEVSAEDDVGYRATVTLAGSRMRTDYKDVANQIDVLTEEFMVDVGAVNLNDAYAYTLNVEGREENPNTDRFSGGPFDHNTTGNNRARGLAPATLSRGFFKTNFISDTYNTQRITVASGPNSILFGLGSPSGIIDATPRRGETHRNTYHAGLRFDDRGSVRVEGDFNQALIKDKLAVRFSLLYSDGKDFLKPNYDQENRYYGAVTWKPIKQLTLGVHYENIDRDVSASPYGLPDDKILPYTDPTAGNMVSYNNITGTSNGVEMARPPHLGSSNGNERPTLFIKDGKPDTTFPMTASLWKYKQVGVQMAIRYAGPNNNGNGLDFQPGDYFYIPEYNSGDFMDASIPPGTYDDALEYNIMGNTTQMRIEGDIITAYAEWQPLENLSFALAYNYDDYLERTSSYFDREGFGVSADASENLIDGSPNPNLNNYVTGGTGEGLVRNRTDEEIRLHGVYELDFSDGTEWLGKHNLFGLLSKRESVEIEQRDGRTWKTNVDGSEPSVVTRSNSVSTANNYMVQRGRTIDIRQNLDPSAGIHYMSLMEGYAPFDLEWQFPDPEGGTMRATIFDPEWGGVKAASSSKYDMKSAILGYQGFLWDDRIALTGGYRWDDTTVDVMDGATDRISPTGMYKWYTTMDWVELLPEARNTNYTFGGVFHAKGLADWLSVFYNQSSTNDRTINKYHPDGSLIDPLTGTGKDYGFMTTFNRFSLRFNFYENTQSNARSSAAGNVLPRSRDQERSWAYSSPDWTPWMPGGFDPVDKDYGIYAPVSDLKSTGEEVVIMTTPIDNWNFRVTVAHIEAIETNIAPEWTEYVEARQPDFASRSWYWQDETSGEWLPVVQWNPDVDYRDIVDPGSNVVGDTTGEGTGHIIVGAAGDTPISGYENIPYMPHWMDWGPNQQTEYEHFQNQLYGNSVLVYQQREGKVNPNTREWRANLTTNYQFTEGALAGLRLGGSIRYRSSNFLGHGYKLIELEGTGRMQGTADTDVIYRGSDEIFVDPFISYSGRMWEDKVAYRVQLNIMNVFDNSGPYSTKADTKGRTWHWSQYAGRKFVLSFAFDL